MIKKKFIPLLISAIGLPVLHAAENDQNATKLNDKVTLKAKHTSLSIPNSSRKVSFSKDIVIISPDKRASQPKPLRANGEDRRKNFAKKHQKTFKQIVQENNK